MLVPRPKLAGDVRAGFRSNPNSGGGRSTRAGQQALRNRAGRGMSGNPGDSGPMFAASGISRYHCGKQGVAKSRAESVFVRTVVMQIFVEPGGDCMLNRLLHGVGGKSGTEMPREACDSVLGVARVGNPCARSHSRDCPLTECIVFPILYTRMARLRVSAGSLHRRPRNPKEKERTPHISTYAIDVPCKVTGTALKRCLLYPGARLLLFAPQQRVGAGELEKQLV
jgi:hypothetical protein